MKESDLPWKECLKNLDFPEWADPESALSPSYFFQKMNEKEGEAFAKRFPIWLLGLFYGTALIGKFELCRQNPFDPDSGENQSDEEPLAQGS